MTLKKDNQDILRDLSEAGFKKLAQDCKSFSERAQDLAEKYKDQKILEGNLLLFPSAPVHLMGHQSS